MPCLHTHDQTALFYTDWGAGKPVVFSHSWALNSDQWAYQMPAFTAAGLRCIALDPKWCEDNRDAFFGTTPVSTGMGDWVMRQIVDTPLKVLLDTAAAWATTDFRAELAALTVPALVIHGDLDASAPIDITGRKT